MYKLFYKLITLIEKVTNIKIIIYRQKKIKGNSNIPKYSAEYLSSVANYINQLSTFTPGNVFEIGANYGQDAAFLQKKFNLNSKDIYIFEPHPEIIATVKKQFNFNCHPLAVSDKNKKTTFHAIKTESKNAGISSLMHHKINNTNDYLDIEVESIRMDTFIDANKIDKIDFLKIDVEGCSYEVLAGFGDKLSIVKSIQIEAEYSPIWTGQKTWDDISSLLLNNGFQLICFELQEDGIQSDSFWIQEKLIKHKIYNISTDSWHNT